MKLEDRLVCLAEEIVGAARNDLQGKEDSGRTQASNAISVACATDSILVFKNWLRYQRAREAFWRGQADLAKLVNEALDQISKQVSDEVRQARGESVNADQLAAEIRTKTMEAVVRFLGYFRRALYAVKDDSFDKILAACGGDNDVVAKLR